MNTADQNFLLGVTGMALGVAGVFFTSFRAPEILFLGPVFLIGVGLWLDSLWKTWKNRKARKENEDS